MRWLLAILLFTSCSAEYHYNKACKKDTSYCATVVRLDTFTVRDTFIHTQVDTLNTIDTISIDTGSIRVQIIREHDVIRTTITQKPDTAYISVIKKIPPKIVTKYKTPFWVYLLCLLMFMFFLILILNR